MSWSPRGILAVVAVAALTAAGCSDNTAGRSAVSSGSNSSATPTSTSPSSAGTSPTPSVKAVTARWYAGSAGTDLNEVVKILQRLKDMRTAPNAQIRATCRKLGPIGSAMLKATPPPFVDTWASNAYLQIATFTKDAGPASHKHSLYPLEYDLKQIISNERSLVLRLRALGVLP